MSENQSKKKPSTSFAEDQLELRNYLKHHNFHHQYLDEDYPVDPFTIEHCLQNFTMLDILDENNKFICDKCVSTKAGKLNIIIMICVTKRGLRAARADDVTESCGGIVDV